MGFYLESFDLRVGDIAGEEGGEVEDDEIVDLAREERQVEQPLTVAETLFDMEQYCLVAINING